MTSAQYLRGKGLSNPMLRQAAFWIFVALVLIGGGASRSDVLSLVYLRPVAVAMLAFALWQRSVTRSGSLGSPFWLTVALALVVAAQLVPLPPSMWTQLPGRDLVVAVHRAAEIPLVWRPLSLTPAATWNALFALTVPLATIALYSIQSEETRRLVPVALILAGVASMALGLMQLAGGAESALYHYRIHTDGRAVGLFANRNHNAMFLALTLFAATLEMLRLDPKKPGWSLRFTALFGYALLTLPFVMILGSRAGLVLCILATVIGAVLVVWFDFGRKPAGAAQQGRMAKGLNAFKARWFIALAGLSIFAILGFLAVQGNRGEAFVRIFDSTLDSGISRAEILPIVLAMVRDQFPWGSGFGSFSELFKSYETMGMLSNFYFNQAHNDWLQLVIEGGLPAALILVAALAWLVRMGWRLVRGTFDRPRAAQVPLFAMFMAIALASAGDYPLRVPIIAMTMAFAAMMISEPPAFFGPRPHSGQRKQA